MRHQHIVVDAFCILLACSIVLGTTGTAASPPLATPHRPFAIQTVEDLPFPVFHPALRQQTAPKATAVGGDPDLVDLLAQLDEALMLTYLENLTSFGPRETGTVGCELAAAYIYDAFADLGLQVRYHNWTEGDLSSSNVEAVLPGNGSENVFIVCGHYDTVATGPGADDDGSGVAAVLAAASLLTQTTLQHTVRFVAFSGEEQGLIGSHYYALECYENNDSIVAVLNADMIGYTASPEDGHLAKVYFDAPSEWICSYTTNVSIAYEDLIDIEVVPSGTTWGSDHYSFWEFGFPAVFYHEYKFNDYYHGPDDTIEHMNLSYTVRHSRLILGTLAELAGQPRPVLAVTALSGGLGCSVTLENIGDEAGVDVNWTVTITGGMLGLLNKSKSVGLATLGIGESSVQRLVAFGLGKVTITVTSQAANAGLRTKSIPATALGPFIIL